jgi:flagellar protein FlaG
MFRKGRYIMVSETQNISSAQRSPVLPVAQAAAAPVPATPRVVAPKPVEIQYDEAKSRKNLQDAVSALNDQMAASKTGLGFSIDKSLAQPVVIVRNTETGEVVRQIPTEVVVRLARSIDDMKGLLLNAEI